MNIQSKYDGGEKIWFFENFREPKFYEGTISRIERWDSTSGWKYYIEHITPEGIVSKHIVDEDNIFDTKKQITDNLFEANGKLADPEEGEGSAED